jgi:hypothetical protein
MAVSLTVEWHPTRTAAGRAERDAIRTEKPLHNVMHTPRNRVPLAQRLSSEVITANRGDTLLAVLEQHFQGQIFSTSDVIAVAPHSESAVQKNMNALASRGAVIAVGARHVVPAKGGRRTSTLYMLPVQQWIDRATGKPLEPARIPPIKPEPRKRKPPRIALPKKPVFIPQQHAPAEDGSLPPVVTFASGASLLIALGYVDRITDAGIRYISRTAEDWPFGEGKPHPYGKAGNAQTMNTEAFLEFFRNGVRRGGQGRPSASNFRTPGGGQ